MFFCLLCSAALTPRLYSGQKYSVDVVIISKPRMTLNVGFGGVPDVLDSCTALELVGQAPKGRGWVSLWTSTAGTQEGVLGAPPGVQRTYLISKFCAKSGAGVRITLI